MSVSKVSMLGRTALLTVLVTLHGGQFAGGTLVSRSRDECILSHSVAKGRAGWTYYLVNSNYSIDGTGNADGSVIERLDYSSSGDFVGGGPGPTCAHDADGDGDVDLADFASLQACFGSSDADIAGQPLVYDAA